MFWKVAEKWDPCVELELKLNSDPNVGVEIRKGTHHKGIQLLTSEFSMCEVFSDQLDLASNNAMLRAFTRLEKLVNPQVRAMKNFSNAEKFKFAEQLVKSGVIFPEVHEVFNIHIPRFLEITRLRHQQDQLIKLRKAVEESGVMLDDLIKIWQEAQVKEVHDS